MKTINLTDLHTGDTVEVKKGCIHLIGKITLIDPDGFFQVDDKKAKFTIKHLVRVCNKSETRPVKNHRASAFTTVDLSTKLGITTRAVRKLLRKAFPGHKGGWVWGKKEYQTVLQTLSA